MFKCYALFQWEITGTIAKNSLSPESQGQFLIFKHEQNIIVQKGFKFVKLKGHAPFYNVEIIAIFNEHACLMIVKVKVDMISGIT